MALALNDRVQQTGTANTTVSFTLTGSITGYQSFAVIGDTNTTYYTATDTSGNWEVGVGTYSTTGPTLTRTTILSSSNSGAAVTFSGTVNVWVDYPAEKAVSTDTLAYPPAIGATTPSTGTFTTLTAQTEVLKGTGQNLLTYSEQFDNSIWQKASVTVTANATTAPDGTSTADKLIVNNGVSTTGADNTGGIYQVPTTLASVAYVFSFYAKSAELTSVKIRESNLTGALASIDLTNGSITYISGNSTQLPVTATLISNGWYRIVVAKVTGSSQTNWTMPIKAGIATGDGTSGVYLWGGQFELATSVGSYIQTTTTAIYGTPTLSFNGASTIGMQSDGSLYVQPAGTGAIQAQATTSSATGGNARGANAVDWQTSRASASQVASGFGSVICGGESRNTASGQQGFVGSGYGNTASAYGATIVNGVNQSNAGLYGFIGAGSANSLSGGREYSAIVTGFNNTANGQWNFIGGGAYNSATSSSVVTSQSSTMNGTTAVTLSGSNANIKVGQYITGTSIAQNTYVAAVSGTSLTLSQNASGSSTSTLSFFTPHGVVVGGGNNQATGSYSFIGGGGDAGTAANRNVASGDWSFVGGGIKNTASGLASFVGGGGTYGTVSANSASGLASVITGGFNNNNSGYGGVISGGSSNSASGNYPTVSGGTSNTVNSSYGTIIGGINGTTRSIVGNAVFPANGSPLNGLGYSQSGLLILARQTTDATATVLTSDANAASGTNQVILPNNSAYYFRGEVIAGVTGAGNTSAWTIEGAIKRGSGVGTTAIVGTVIINRTTYDSGASGWSIAVTADTTNGGLAITVTGQASTTIRWVAQIRTTEMTY